MDITALLGISIAIIIICIFLIVTYLIKNYSSTFEQTMIDVDRFIESCNKDFSQAEHETNITENKRNIDPNKKLSYTFPKVDYGKAENSDKIHS